MFSQRKSYTERTIAIIGSGLSGIATFCQLVDTLIETSNKSIKILLFEKQKNYFCTGAPYAISSPSIWTLNNPAAKFKLTNNGVTLEDWLNANRNKWESLYPSINETYPPRALVGLFLKSQFYDYKKKALANEIAVEKYFDEVIDLLNINEKWRLTTYNRQLFYADTAFLCLGHAPNNQFSHLKECKKFFSFGSDVENLKGIPTEADVYIIGGQASFVDVALWLAVENQHKGRIHTITRNPPIITTKGNNDQCDTAALCDLTQTLQTQFKSNALSFIEAKALLWNTYRLAAKNPVDWSHHPKPQTALSYQINKYKQQSNIDASIGNIDELRSFILNFYFSDCYKELWQKLQDKEKIIFNQQMYSFIFAYLTGITPLNAQLLLALYDRKLIIENNGLTHIDYDDVQEKFILQYSNGDKEVAEYIIDSSGLGYDITKQDTKFPFLSNLVEKGYLVPEKGGGIRLNEYGQPFNFANKLQSNLFCIGPTASYGHPVPTPYASFIAIAAIEKALSVFKNNIHIFKQNTL